MAEYYDGEELIPFSPVEPPVDVVNYLESTVEVVDALARQEASRLRLQSSGPDAAALQKWQRIAAMLTRISESAHSAVMHIEGFAEGNPALEVSEMSPDELRKHTMKVSRLSLAQSILPGTVLNQNVKPTSLLPPISVKNNEEIAIQNETMRLRRGSAQLFIFNALLALPRTPIRSVDIRNCGFERSFAVSDPVHHLSRNIKRVVDFLSENGGILSVRGRGSNVRYQVHPATYVDDRRSIS